MSQRLGLCAVMAWFVAIYSCILVVLPQFLKGLGRAGSFLGFNRAILNPFYEIRMKQREMFRTKNIFDCPSLPPPSENSIAQPYVQFKFKTAPYTISSLFSQQIFDSCKSQQP